MPSPIAANPVVPRFGVAVAALGQSGIVAANPLWRSLGALLQPPPLRPARTVCYQPLHFAHHRLPVWAALARPEESRHWPQIDQLSPATPARLHALAFIPSRAPEFTRRAAHSFRLADTERDTLEQLLISHDIAELGHRLGVTRAGARKRAEALYRTIGTTSIAGLIATISQLFTDEFISDHQQEPALQAVLGLSPAQASVARLIAAGHSLPLVASRLRLSPHTVRDHARMAREKAEVSRLKDFAQVATEAAAVHSIVTGADGLHHDRFGLLDATLILHREGRQIALADFGPDHGRPLLVCHGGMATRGLGLHLRRALQAQGFRPIGIDRPGFGLTDPSSSAPQFAAAADDMAFALDTLNLPQAALLSLDTGAATALAFWQSHGERMTIGALMSPRPPARPRSGTRLADRFARAAMQRPDVINSLWKQLRTRAGAAMALWLAERLFASHPLDAALLADPDFRAGLAAELLTCGARSGQGISAELAAYQHWQPAPGPPRAWTIILAEQDPLWAPSLTDPAARAAWHVLGQPDWHVLKGAGRFAITSHAEAIAAVLAAKCERPRTETQVSPNKSAAQ
ncbi:MAG: alpha/beta fold hydrolase [Polymorphobacter sp.]|uniref:alpha/beta fold hydrolase n=1 Tax=Polymorphobacter sp. TaxID=1909290 RepID=UPI003A8B9591